MDSQSPPLASPPATPIWNVIGTVLLWLFIANITGWFISVVTRIDYYPPYFLIILFGLARHWKNRRIRNGFLIALSIPLCALFAFFLLAFYPSH